MCAGAHLRGFQDHAVAAGKRHGDRPHGQNHRGIPGRDAKYHADRLPVAHGEAAGNIGGDHLSGNLGGHGGGLAQHAGAQRAVEAGPHGGGTGFCAHDRGELASAAFQQVGGLVEQGATRARGRFRPGREGLSCRVAGTADIGDGGCGSPRGNLAGQWIKPVEGAAGGGLAVGIGDQQLNVEHGATPVQCGCRRQRRGRLSSAGAVGERGCRPGRRIGQLQAAWAECCGAHLGCAAEVDLLHGRLALQAGGAALADNPTVLDEIAAVGNGQALVRVLLHQQHADAEASDAGERLEQLLADQRRQAERRLVEQKQTRMRHQRPADAHHLLLAAAHGADNLLLALGQARKQRQDLAETCRLVLACAPGIGPQQQVLTHIELGENPAVLRHEHQPCLHHLVSGQVRELDPIQHDAPARGGRDDATQRLQAGGLAGAVGAQQDDDLTAAHRERSVIKGKVLTVKNREPRDLQHCSFPTLPLPTQLPRDAAWHRLCRRARQQPQPAPQDPTGAAGGRPCRHRARR